MELGDDGNGQVLQETKQASACKSCFPQWQDTESWSPDSTAQETVQTRNPSEIVPFKDLKGQCNLLSGYLNESWQLQVNRCLKLSAWFPSSLPSPSHPPKGAAFVLWLLKALCEPWARARLEHPAVLKGSQLVWLLSLLALWLERARALLSMWNHD